MASQLPNRRYLEVLLFLFILDIVCLLASWNLSYLLRFSLLEQKSISPLPLEEYLSINFILLGISLIFLPIGNLYEPKLLIHSRFGILPLLRAIFLILGGLAVFFFFYRELSFSRLAILLFAGLSFCSMLFIRICLKYCLRYFHRKGKLIKRVLIIGNGTMAKKFYSKVDSSKQLGLQIIGYIANQQNLEMPHYLGNYKSLESILYQKNIQQVYIALDTSEQGELIKINKIISRHPADLFIVPDIYQSLNIRPEVFSMREFIVLSIRQTPLFGLNLFIKKIFDISFSLTFLILFSPVFLILALLVKLSSKGHVFYTQERMGLDGKVFKIYKFRSMKTDAEKQSGAVWAKQSDNRTTPIGSILRKTSLDEIPQFYNVLKGDMSIVGPRPERPVFIEKFNQEIPYYMQRHKIKAGITGWAQINGLRGNTSLEKRVEADLYYINHWSIWLDIKIVFLTAFRIFYDENAY